MRKTINNIILLTLLITVVTLLAVNVVATCNSTNYELMNRCIQINIILGSIIGGLLLGIIIGGMD